MTADGRGSPCGGRSSPTSPRTCWPATSSARSTCPGAWLASAAAAPLDTSGYFRLDVDLDAPAPWADERLAEATVVHVTGDLDELALSQAEVRRGRLPDAAQLILGQQDRADPSRVPPGAASLWVECHCPAGPRGARADWEPRFAERVLDRLERTRPACAGASSSTTSLPPLELQAPRPQPRRR